MLIFLLRKGVEETKDKVVVGKTKVEEVVLAQIACQCRILIFVWNYNWYSGDLRLFNAFAIWRILELC